MASPAGEGDVIHCAVSDSFAHWLSRAGGSLAITTYQAGKVVLVGWDGRQVTVLMRQFDKPMGLAVQGPRLALATRHQVWLFANAPLLAPDYLETQRGKYDALYLPRTAYFTGDLNVHDLAYGADGLWLVNNRFCCLAALSKDFSFVPRWKPPFLSEIVPEDRCHLNGLALVDGKPRYVTALGETDTVGGWRPGKASGGIVIDVETNQIVLRGLSMPHSPRWHNGRLWLLNSGAGELCVADPDTGQRTVVCALPGYLRGLLPGRAVRPGGAVPGSREAHLRRIAGAAAAPEAALRRGGHRYPHRPADRHAGIHLRLPGAVRSAVPPRRLPAHDPEPGARRGPPGLHRPGLLLLAAAEQRNPHAARGRHAPMTDRQVRPEGSQDQAVSGRVTMKKQNPGRRFLLCVCNDDYPVSLELRKVYRALPDPKARARGYVRVIDESGEDYLYPTDYFVPVRLPQAVVKGW